MKKIFKWASIIIGSLLLLIILSIVALPFFIPLEKIKDFATAKISETIKREVAVKSVSFNIFTGIKLEGLLIGNREGFTKKPFVSADAIALRYAFWPLFRREIIIKEIQLVKPEILVEKNAAGEMNFSDMLAPKKVEDKKAPPKAPGFSLIVDTFSIRNGKITYLDHGTKTSSGLKDADLSLSGFTLALLKPLKLNFSAMASYQGKDIPINLSGDIGIDQKNEVLKLSPFSLGAAGEKASLSASVSKWKSGPDVSFSISSSKFTVDPLFAVFTAGASAPKKEKLKPGELTTTINKLTASIPNSLNIKGDINLGKVSFMQFFADKANLSLSLSNKKASADIKEIKFYDGTISGRAQANLNAPGLTYNGSLKLDSFNAAPFSNAVVETFLIKLPDYKDLTDKVYGTLNASLTFSGQGVEAQDIMANAFTSGTFSLKDGSLKRLKMIDAIADKINTPALKQDLKISEVSGNFELKNQVLNVKSLSLKDSDVGASFKGGLDLKNLKYVDGNRLTLRASPSATQGLSKEFDLLRDSQGWLEATFELKGSLKMPIPYPVLDKPLEKVTEKVKLKIEAEKIELQKKAEQKAEEEKKRLEEEAKEKVKELFKF